MRTWQIRENILKLGGSGSGNFGHAGRPGKRGGSTPQKGGGGFNADEWNAMSFGDRMAKWEGMSVGERDKLANAEKSVISYQDMLLKHGGERPAFTGDIEEVLDARLAATTKILGKDYIPEDDVPMIKQTVMELDSYLEKAGVDPASRYQLTMEAADALVAQDKEALNRTLGDHGIHHIRGNIETMTDIITQQGGTDQAHQMATGYLATVFHDTGYLAPPARNFLDEGHPRWSQQHYSEHLQPLVKDAMGSRVANEVGHIIRTHDASNVDWKSDTIGSACRVSDNLAIFHEDKLPPLFRHVPSNVKVLDDLAAGNIDVPTARSRMQDNVAASNLSPSIRTNLTRATSEINPVSPKFILGMMGGSVDKLTWNKGTLDVYLKHEPKAREYQKVLDLGQKQFAKFGKAYGYSAEQFGESLQFEFKDPAGNVLLRSYVDKTLLEKLFLALRMI